MAPDRPSSAAANVPAWYTQLRPGPGSLRRARVRVGILTRVGAAAQGRPTYTVSPQGRRKRVYSAAVLTPSKCRGRPVRPAFCSISLNRPLNSASPPAWRLIMYATPSTACKVLPNRESVGRLPAGARPIASARAMCYARQGAFGHVSWCCVWWHATLCAPVPLMSDTVHRPHLGSP